MASVGRHGAGSITKRKTGPPYQVSLTMPGGKRVYRYARTLEQAKAQLKELRNDRENDVDPSRQTVADFLHSWILGLRDAKRQRVRPRTLEHYELIVEKHIVPALGKHRLSGLRVRHVQAWLDSESVAPRTLHHHRAVLRRALNLARRQRLIGDNAAIGVELPDATYSGAKPLTVTEAQAIAEATVGDRLHALWLLAIDTGLRQSELLGLGWDDIDLDAGTVTVTSQLQRINGQWVRTQTKAARSLHRLALSAVTVDALREHQRKMADERKPDWVFYGLVFPSIHGQPLTNNVVLREWRLACDQAKIERRRFHDLRHTADTLMEELGVPENVRMARLGHGTTQMARRYTKPSETRDREASDVLGRALRR